MREYTAKIKYIGDLVRCGLVRYRFRRVVLYCCQCGVPIARYHQRRGEEYIHSICRCGRDVDVQLVRNDYRECFGVGKGCRLTTPLHESDMEFKTGEELLHNGGSSDDST